MASTEAAPTTSKGPGDTDLAGASILPHLGGEIDGLSTLAAGWALAVGASLGSFAALAASRVPWHRPLWQPRSACHGCHNTLAWFDLVPIISWLLLAGRCRRCNNPIGLRALTCELIMAAIALAVVSRWGLSAKALLWLPALALLLAAALVDIDYWWVPDRLLVPAAALLAAGAWLPGMPGFAGAVLGCLPALALAAISQGWSRLRRQDQAVGLGDVKLLAVLGLGLGPMGAYAALVLAALQGLLAWPLVRLTGGHPAMAPGPPPPAVVADQDWVPPPSALPFAPFLFLGGLEILLDPFAGSRPWWPPVTW